MSKVSSQRDTNTEVGNYARYTVTPSDSVTAFILYQTLMYLSKSRKTISNRFYTACLPGQACVTARLIWTSIVEEGQRSGHSGRVLGSVMLNSTVFCFGIGFARLSSP